MQIHITIFMQNAPCLQVHITFFFLQNAPCVQIHIEIYMQNAPCMQIHIEIFIVMQHAVAVKRRIGVEHPANRRSSRRWLQRWRRRCGTQLRRGNVREQLTPHQMHGKVTHGAAQKSPGGWTGFGLPGRRVEKNGDHFPGPKSRPRSRVVIKTVPGKWSPFFCRCGPRTQKMGTIFWEGWDPGFRFSGPLDGVGWGPGFVLRRPPCGGGATTSSTWIHLTRSEC